MSLPSFFVVVLAACVALCAAQGRPLGGNYYHPLVVNYCNAGSSGFQEWTLTPNQTSLYLTSTAKTNKIECMAVEAGVPGATVATYECGYGSGEGWQISGNNSIRSLANATSPTCLSLATVVGSIFNGTLIVANVCDGTDSLQDFSYSAATGLLTHNPSGLCVDGGSTIPKLDFCTTGNHSDWTICDTSASIDDRSADIVSRISLADKFQALGTATPFLSSIEMSATQWW